MIKSKILLSTLLVIFLANLTAAATLSGKVYDDSLTKIDNAIVEINTLPIQRAITESGQYTFQVQPGNYTITAKYNDLFAAEIVSIANEGTYRIDLILFPSLEDELADISNISIGAIFEDEPKIRYEFLYITIIILFIIIIYLLIKKKKKIEKKTKKSIEELKQFTKSDATPDKIIAFIKKEGGRTTQKAIRKEFPLSEAKISLMIAELENAGKIRKIKKGRANIVILNEI
ncbi:hypothetical protein DRJ17_01560 [Candidatus Woesearchaeota archaeon]|nr:MAG: hypothetical protein DRJ17_01560 [Candidatus Woesearchaeota archaeon]